jgi:signal transduction histidine kinase
MAAEVSGRSALWEGATIRVRTTAAAGLVVGGTLVLAAVAMVAFLRASIRDDVLTTAEARADALSAGLRSGAGFAVVATGEADEEFIQVVDADGTVLDATSNVDGRAALVRLSPGGVATVDHVPFEDGSFVAVARASVIAGTPVTVIVGRSLEDVDEATRPVVASLLVGVPLLLLVVGAVTWRVVGRALDPVERIRRQVDGISTEELHRRVPEPAGSDEISRLAATMNRMLDRLQAGHERQRRFVSDASHELRSPVASLRQHGEVAHAHPDRTELSELSGVVLEESARLERIVDDLLLLTRIDEGAWLPEAAAVDLDDIVLAEATRLRSSTGLAIDTRGVSAGRVLGDPRTLERLVRNLTENAARYATSAVSLSLSERDGQTVLRVDDDGPGITPSDRERVFDRFVRLDDARDRDSGGSGLGLAIVKEIARLDGGAVSIGEAEIGGARVEVRLPSGDL